MLELHCHCRRNGYHAALGPTPPGAHSRMPLAIEMSDLSYRYGRTDAVQVVGNAAFHDTSLVNDVTYLGVEFSVDADVRVTELIERHPPLPTRVGGDLCVERNRHMHRLSDGQRRRMRSSPSIGGGVAGPLPE